LTDHGLQFAIGSEVQLAVVANRIRNNKYGIRKEAEQVIRKIEANGISEFGGRGFAENPHGKGKTTRNGCQNGYV
jgi:hypothetical protein